MVCEKKTTQKYLNRRSPPFPANECRGQLKSGNDGNLWESRGASNSVYRWVPYGSKRSKPSSKSPKSKKKSPKKRTRKTLRGGRLWLSNYSFRIGRRLNEVELEILVDLMELKDTRYFIDVTDEGFTIYTGSFHDVELESDLEEM